MTHLLWLSDDAWAAIEPHLPRGKPGKPRVDDRRVISGILHVLKTGCRWRDCPAKYGPHTTIYNRYNRWSKRRIWQRIFEKMAAAGPVPEELLHRYQSCQSAPLGGWVKKGEYAEAIGRSRGGRTSKIHALADDRGQIIAYLLGGTFTYLLGGTFEHSRSPRPPEGFISPGSIDQIPAPLAH